MRMTKKITSIVLVVLMVVSMMSVMAISASATVTNISTLNELKDACLNGGEYSMTCDIPFKASFDVKSDVTIHGNGHSIYYGDGMASSSNYTFSMFANAKLTLDNVTLNGESNVGAKAMRAVSMKNSNVGNNRYTINFTDVTVKNYGGDSYVGALNLYGCPEATLTNCTFTNNGSRCTIDSDGSTGKDVWVGTGTAANPATLTISGGTYDGSIFLNSSASVAASGTLKDDAKVKKVYLDTTSGNSSTLDIQDTSTVGVLINETVVDQVNSADYDNVVIHDEASLRAALAAGGEWIVANNIVCAANEQLVAAKDLTLDLNGKSITENTIYSSPDTNKGGFLVKDGANVVIDNGTLNLNNDYYGIKLEGAELTLGSKLVVNAPEGNMVGSDCTLNVNGTINTTNWFAIGTNGSTSHNYTININDGANVTSTKIDAAGIYHCNDGTLNITGGKVTGASAVIVKSGTTNISGGTLTGTRDAYPFEHNGNGAEPTGDALLVESCNYPGGTPAVNVTKGTFTVTGSGTKAVGVYSQNEEAYAPASGFISGGTYSTPIAEDYIVPGKILYKSGAKFYTKADDNPLNSLEAVGPVTADGNNFGIQNDYLAGSLIGVQKKDKASVGAPETSESGQEGEKNMRFVAVLETQLLKKADDYGFVLAKANSKDSVVFDNLKAGDDRAKTISAKGTYNNVCGDGDYSAYGDPTDSSTDYKYVTCAVNDVTDSDKIVARFYVKKDGKTYYAKYAKGGNYNDNVTGAFVAWTDLA